MGGEDGPVDELGLVVGEDALETEQERELAPPGGRRLLEALGDLGEGDLEGAPARRMGRERDGGVLAFVEEALAREFFRARDLGGTRGGRNGQ